MEKSLISLVIVLFLLLGTIMPICYGAALSLVSSETNNIREECIRQVAHYLEQIEISVEVRKLVSDMEMSYNSDRFATNFKFESIPAGCINLHRQVRAIRSSIPCYYDQTVMGADELQNVKDVIKANEQAKYVVESEYVCFHNLATGPRLREDGLFEMITGRKWSPKKDPWTPEDGEERPSYGRSHLAPIPGHNERPASVLYNFDARPDDPSKLEEWERRRQLVQGNTSPRKLLVKVLNESSADYNPSMECSICHDELGSDSKAAELTNCGHLFHKDCLMSWSKTSEKNRQESLCPVCRETFQVWDE